MYVCMYVCHMDGYATRSTTITRDYIEAAPQSTSSIFAYLFECVCVESFGNIYYKYIGCTGASHKDLRKTQWQDDATVDSHYTTPQNLIFPNNTIWRNLARFFH